MASKKVCHDSSRTVVVLVVMMTLLSLTSAVQKLRVDDLAGATRVNLRKRSGESESITSHIGLEQDVGLEVEDSLVSAQGTTKRKYRETFRNIKVYNSLLDVEQDQSGNGNIVNADLYQGLEEDLAGQLNCELSESEAERITLEHFGASEQDVEGITTAEWIYIDENEFAHDALDVELVIINSEGKVSRPHAFISKCTHAVLESFDRIGFCVTDRSTESTAVPTPSRTYSPRPPTRPTTYYSTTAEPEPTCPPALACDVKQKGGNEKRCFEYGLPDYCLLLSKSEDGKTCYLENKYVKGVDLTDARIYGFDTSRFTDIARFECASGYQDAVNGAYSPMLDAFFFATKSLQMYRDWYDYEALADPIPYVKAHFFYGMNMTNAFWDGESFIIGDGDGIEAHPLAVLDVVNHEVSHGVTERTSNLEYWRQSGGINEAFSDMAGEVAELYLYGYNDWMIGADVFVTYPALRYFDDPTRDLYSIKHVMDYQRYTDVHYSSGIYNHVFYQMAYTWEMGVRAAFECFLNANRLYWRETTDFEEGACGTLRGAYDAGYDLDIVAESFRTVGIYMTECPCLAEFVTAELKPSEERTGLCVSKLRNPLFKVQVPHNVNQVKVTSSGGVEISISRSYKRSAKPIVRGPDSVVAWLYSEEFCTTLYVRLFVDPNCIDQGERTEVSVSVEFDPED